MDQKRKKVLTILVVIALIIPMLLAGVRNIYASTVTKVTPITLDDGSYQTIVEFAEGSSETVDGNISLEEAKRMFGDETAKPEAHTDYEILSKVYVPETGMTTVTVKDPDGNTSSRDIPGDYESKSDDEIVAALNKEDTKAADEKNNDKSSFQIAFEEAILSQVLNMNIGEEGGSSLSTQTLMNRTFAYAIAIMEGADKAPSGYLGDEGLGSSLSGYGGLVHETWYKFLEVAAILVMFIRFMVDYSMDKVWQTTEQSTPEQMFKPLFRLIVGFFFILLVHWFLAMGLYLSQAAFSVLSKGTLTTESLSLYQEMADKICTKLGFTDAGITKAPQNLGALAVGVITFFIPLVVSGLSGLGVIFVVFSRVIELVVRAVFAPLAMTDCYKSGENTHGFRYVMEFFGIAFQSLAIFAVLWVSSMVCGMFTQSLKESAGLTDSIGQVSQIAIYIAGLKLAQLVLLMKTSSIMKSVFG